MYVPIGQYPISQCSLKLLQRLIPRQLVDYLQPKLQSAYRAHHFVKTAVLCLRASDSFLMLDYVHIVNFRIIIIIRFWATRYKHWTRITSQYLLCSTCRQCLTRSIMRSYCGVCRRHMVWEAACWAGSPHTSVAVHNMSSVVGQCRTSSNSFVVFHRVQSLGRYCSCCTWRICCGLS